MLGPIKRHNGDVIEINPATVLSNIYTADGRKDEIEFDRSNALKELYDDYAARHFLISGSFQLFDQDTNRKLDDKDTPFRLKWWYHKDIICKGGIHEI